MQPDDKLCLCFHITKRKVTNFIRIEEPKVASQLSECGGAGTGCGWCRPFLKRLLAESLGESVEAAEFLSHDEYSASRSRYVKEGGGVPPAGATPVD